MASHNITKLTLEDKKREFENFKNNHQDAPGSARFTLNEVAEKILGIYGKVLLNHAEKYIKAGEISITIYRNGRVYLLDYRGAVTLIEFEIRSQEKNGESGIRRIHGVYAPVTKNIEGVIYRAEAVAALDHAKHESDEAYAKARRKIMGENDSQTLSDQLEQAN